MGVRKQIAKDLEQVLERGEAVATWRPVATTPDAEWDIQPARVAREAAPSRGVPRRTNLVVITNRRVLWCNRSRPSAPIIAEGGVRLAHVRDIEVRLVPPDKACLVLMLRDGAVVRFRVPSDFMIGQFVDEIARQPACQARCQVDPRALDRQGAARSRRVAAKPAIRRVSAWERHSARAAHGREIRAQCGRIARRAGSVVAVAFLALTTAAVALTAAEHYLDDATDAAQPYVRNVCADEFGGCAGGADLTPIAPEADADPGSPPPAGLVVAPAPSPPAAAAAPSDGDAPSGAVGGFGMLADAGDQPAVEHVESSDGATGDECRAESAESEGEQPDSGLDPAAPDNCDQVETGDEEELPPGDGDAEKP